MESLGQGYELDAGAAGWTVCDGARLALCSGCIDGSVPRFRAARRDGTYDIRVAV